VSYVQSLDMKHIIRQGRRQLGVFVSWRCWLFSDIARAARRWHRPIYSLRPYARRFNRNTDGGRHTIIQPGQVYLLLLYHRKRQVTQRSSYIRVASPHSERACRRREPCSCALAFHLGQPPRDLIVRSAELGGAAVVHGANDGAQLALERLVVRGCAAHVLLQLAEGVRQRLRSVLQG